MAPVPDAALVLASGVPLAVLGALLLAPRPRRPPQVFFGAFAVLWGTSIVLMNLGRALNDLAVHRVAFMAALALVPPAYVFFVHFAVRSSPGRSPWWPTVAAGSLGAAAAATLAFAPRLVIEGFEPTPTGFITTLGPAMLLVGAPFYGALFLVLGVLYRRYRRAAPGTSRHRARGLVLALALFVSYEVVRTIATPANPLSDLRISTGWNIVGVAALYLGGLGMLVAIVAHLVLRPPAPEGVDRVLVAAFVVPAAAALAEVSVPALAATQGTAGLWRLAMVAVLAHTLARHQLFDLDLRLKRLAGPVAAAVALGLGSLGAVVLAAGGAPLPAALPPLALGAVGAGVALAAGGRLGAALFPAATSEPDYIYQRKLEVYNAVLERVLEGGKEGASAAADHDQLLRTVRRRLGISEREHQVMAYMVRQGRTSRGTAGATGGAAGSERARIGATVLGRYRVERLLGEGAHGRAFLCLDEQVGRQVVLKVVGTALAGGAAAKRLMREARLVGSLRHPNVIGVHDVGETSEEAHIVMEFADGGSLAGLLQRRPRLGTEEAVRLADQVLSGLGAAHAAGIVHRDLKPDNILLLGDGTVKVADFGVAREARADATGLTMGAPVGTLLYMSPEQVRGHPADPRSDVYAAGVVLYLVLAGRFYLRIAGKDDFQVRQLILKGPPQLPLKDQPAWLNAVLARSLAKDPEDRFPSADAMRQALRAHAEPAAGPAGERAAAPASA